jgi:DNA mismatch repair protein MutS
MMRQFLAVKAQHPDAIVFYRMGDFYEMFLHDAEVAAPLLDIALTTRDKDKADSVPMCGFPVHAAAPYIKRLAELGHRIAVCEQVEDAKATGGKRLVKREVVEVITPGLVGDPDGIEGARQVCLAALDLGSPMGLAILDASTGEFRATQVEAEPGEVLPAAIVEELQRVDPREVLIAGGQTERVANLEPLLPSTAWTQVAADSYDPARVTEWPEGFDSSCNDPAMRASAALLGYVADHQPFALIHSNRLRVYRLTDTMILDAATRAHLELFRNSEDGSRARTLIERLDLSMTPLGARRLVRWLAYPLVDPESIGTRQNQIEYLYDRDRPRARLREALKPVRDLERLLAKAARPNSAPRDLAALRGSLEALAGVRAALAADDGDLLPSEGGAQTDLLTPPQALPELSEMLRDGLIDDPPVVARGSRGANETGYIRDGFRSELDALRDGISKGRDWIAGFESRERETTGIPTLKIRFHPVHGYAIEVSKANLNRVPENYERKQTLANAERFTTVELRREEQSVRGGTERAAALERSIFEELRALVLEQATEIQQAAYEIGSLDALASLAEVARRDGWTRPIVDEGVDLEIDGGRHPVIEPLLAAKGGEEFVPNETRLGVDGTQILVLTGPNMSGKSTYLRQVALIVLLAQMGSFVPAERARVGVVDRVFTRVGASDRLARGESTFMVEMRETAEILNSASRRSLVILDEIGRGTSTFDGLSIAWAVAEYLHDTPGLGARTLFATHYHELADLARTKARVDNAHFEAKEWGDEVIFLRRLVAGAANRSYGIQVARLAGLPDAVIARARIILDNLEGEELDERGRPRLAGPRGSDEQVEDDQLGLFQIAKERNATFDGVRGGARDQEREKELEALKLLEGADPNRTTPLEALDLLSQMVTILRGEVKS